MVFQFIPMAPIGASAEFIKKENEYARRTRPAYRKPSDPHAFTDPDTQPHADPQRVRRLIVGPGDFYILAIVVTALFVAPFNGLARIIVFGWMAGHVAFTLGLPEETVNLAQHGMCVVLGLRYTRPRANLVSWALFAPLLAVDLVRFGSESHDVASWWMVLGLAGLQIALLPIGMNRKEALAHWREWGRSLVKWPLWWERRFAGI